MIHRELRKVFYSWLPVYYDKGHNSGIPRWKRHIGQNIGQGTKLPCPLPSTLRTSVYSLTRKFSEPHCSGVFLIEISLSEMID
jgi:hypothetical protein